MKYLLLFIPIYFITVTATAQVSANYKITFLDSIVLEQNTHILSNAIRISKIGSSKIKLGVKFIFPPYWRVISKLNNEDLQSIALKHGETKVIPINLLESPKIKAEWDVVKLKTWICNTTDTAEYDFHISVRSRSEFTVDHLNEFQDVADSVRRVISIRSIVRNTGNVPDNYIVKCTNQLLGIDKTLSFRLLAGQDTTVDITAKIKRSVWKHLYSEGIYFKVSGSKANKLNTFIYNIVKPSSRISQTDHTYKIFPLTIGGGILLNGDQIVYFGQAKGSLQIGAHSINFSYRSKDFGYQAYVYQPNAFYISYGYKGWLVEAGQIRGPRNFFTSGQGLSIAYTGKHMGFSLAGMKYSDAQPNNSYKNDNVYGSLNYQIGKATVQHIVETNFNSFTGLSDYLLNNEIYFINNKNTILMIFGGPGYEQNLADTLAATHIDLGYNAGYNVKTSYRKWLISSNVKYNSNKYPGIYRGSHIEQHLVKYDIGSFYLNATFYLSSIQRNDLRDTIYNSDYLSTNTSRYGIGFGHFKGVNNFNISFGFINKTGSSQGIKNGNYFDGTLKLHLGKASDLLINSINAFQLQKNSEPQYSTNSHFNLSSKHFSLTGGYNRIPNYDKADVITDYTETVLGGPSVNFALFKRSLSGSFRYTIAKTVSREDLRNGIGGQLNFYDHKSELSISLGGFYPLKDPSNLNLPLSETRNGSLSISKRINVPIRKIRLYDVKAILFKDDNNNNTLDDSEQRLENATVVIDNKTFKTNSKGEIKYRHMKPAVYSLNFVNSHGDLIASNGTGQKIDVTADTSLLVPFKKGKRLHGNVHINLDSFSNSILSAENFKVTIIDTFGRVYSALTDASGNFYVYVPQGIYKVSLSSDIFANSDFKPERLSFDVDMFTKEDAFVQFVVKQKMRKVRFINAGKK